jgi:hypothetical protein
MVHRAGVRSRDSTSFHVLQEPARAFSGVEAVRATVRTDRPPVPGRGVRAELAGVVKETPIRLDQDVSIPQRSTAAMMPARYTAAPLQGTALWQPYYLAASIEWSRKQTRPPIGKLTSNDSSVFIFIRLRESSADSTAQTLAENLFLTDATGNVVSSFTAGEIQLNSGEGWMALSAHAPHGFYSLEYRSKPARALCLYLFPRWQSQIFILHHGRPLLDGARIFLAPRETGFLSGHDELVPATDLAFDFLQNGVHLMPHALSKQLREGQVKNPMSGLVGAHILLQQSDPDQWLVERIINDVSALLGDCPDVNGIRLIHALRFGRPINPKTFQYPPLFRVALERILQLSVDHEEILPADGYIERIATHLLTDSPWSSWELDPGTKRSGELRGKHDVQTSVLERDSDAQEVTTSLRINWVQAAVLNCIEMDARRAKGNTKPLYVRSPVPDLQLDVRQLALSLGLPPRNIRTAMAGLGIVVPNLLQPKDSSETFVSGANIKIERAEPPSNIETIVGPREEQIRSYQAPSKRRNDWSCRPRENNVDGSNYEGIVQTRTEGAVSLF